jgi:oligogalacturonide lyase
MSASCHRLLHFCVLGTLVLISPSLAIAQPATGAPAPREWVDADTGHRVHRLTDEPHSAGLYFNMNAYTPDGRQMVYTAPNGIHVLELASRKTRLLVAAEAPGQLRTVVVGRKTPTLYYINTKDRTLHAADIDTGTIRKLADLPPRGRVDAINADETLAAGTFIEGTAGEDYGQRRVNPPGLGGGPLVQPLNKGEMMERRLAARLPMVLFTIDLKTGEQRDILHSTDWLNHLLFSPADPTLLMYCHEGPWHKVDRIWTIRTDGSENQLIHKRTMAMEIAGHEFWSRDGKTIWYDVQTPRGEVFWLAAFDVETKQRRWYHLSRDEWSIHFNITDDGTLICGDGGDPTQVARAENGKWIYLFRPVLKRIDGQSPQGNETLIQPGVLQAERLVNMSRHNYKLEPNVRFTPDRKMVLFSSNIHGPSYVFGVEVEKADPPASSQPPDGR